MFISSLSPYFSGFISFIVLYEVHVSQEIVSCCDAALALYPVGVWYSYLTLVCSVNEEETACLTFAKICFFLLAP